MYIYIYISLMIVDSSCAGDLLLVVVVVLSVCYLCCCCVVCVIAFVFGALVKKHTQTNNTNRLTRSDHKATKNMREATFTKRVSASAGGLCVSPIAGGRRQHAALYSRCAYSLVYLIHNICLIV